MERQGDVLPKSSIFAPAPHDSKSLCMKSDNPVAVCIIIVNGQARNQIQDWWIFFTAFPLLIKISTDAVDEKLYAKFQE